MKSVGVGVREIRIHTGQEHRVLYIAQFAEAVYLLHAFEKRAAKTPQQEVAMARRRLGALIEARRKRNVTQA